MLVRPVRAEKTKTMQRTKTHTAEKLGKQAFNVADFFFVGFLVSFLSLLKPHAAQERRRRRRKLFVCPRRTGYVLPQQNRPAWACQVEAFLGTWTGQEVETSLSLYTNLPSIQTEVSQGLSGHLRGDAG